MEQDTGADTAGGSHPGQVKTIVYDDGVDDNDDDDDVDDDDDDDDMDP